MADDGAHRARPGLVVADAGICRSQPRAGRRAALRILARHIIPNIFGVVITYLALTMPAIILYESFLSYLGLGVQAADGQLGHADCRRRFQINPIRIYWWLIVFPGGVLVRPCWR